MSKSPYPETGRPDFPAIEERVLARWAADGTFQTSVDSRPSDAEYVFYDGPPFANGLPHHGHLLTGYVKDVIPRYQTMRGHRVDRRFGWDCHGLPAEMQAEKELPVAGRADIIEYGIDRFNAQCRQSVLRYTSEWEKTVTRQARWVDFENDYKTMDPAYMESVMWAFKQLWEKGLIYEAFRVMPYSWGAETPLSNFEIRLDDATRPRQDPAITVAFDLVPVDDDPGPMQILAWTTTPWTLPSNLALAVGPDVDYSMRANSDGTVLLVGAEAVERYASQLADTIEIGTCTGNDLVGRAYVPLFDFFIDREDAFRILAADFVDANDGTGVVHMAPGFGEDDQLSCEAAGIPIGRVVPVDDQGCFTDDVTPWAGINVFEANPDIIRYLKEAGRVIRHDTYEHNYPHCWRTDTPIIYKAISSWYVKVTDLRERLLATNAKINWVPDHIRDGRFGMWLDGARDWSISRNRFWGSPIPIWRSDDPAYPRIDVYGSLDEIEQDFGIRPADLHRPFIDELTRPNPDDPSGKSTMRRVPEVLDCWFESGSMPFAQLHYPFENQKRFEEHFPADFIVEYVNQTRGWFYTLHVLATALFDRPAFQNVICHGILLAEDGSKLSKKLRNYTEPSAIFENQGADALRWYLMSSNIVRGGDLRILDSGIDDVVRQVLLPVWNAYTFFTLYANVDGYQATMRTNSSHMLDRYLLARTRRLVESVQERMDAYDLPGATGEIQGFLDALNNWYIRRSRDRFWAPAADATADGPAAESDKSDAHDTLYTVLVTLSRVAAPFLPMVAEEIHAGLVGGVSVHLQDWPNAEDLPSDPDLVDRMDRLRDVASTALRLREDHGLRVRLPLPSITVAGTDSETLADLLDLLIDEVNVKAVSLTNDLESHARLVLRPDGRALGPRLGGNVQAVFAGARSGEYIRNDDDTVTVAGHVLHPTEFDFSVESPDGITAGALDSGDAVVVLDTEVTDELAREGLARDVVRHVQQARRDAQLVVTDRIHLTIDGDKAVVDAVRTHEHHVAGQVLAFQVTYDSPGDMATQVTVEGSELRFSLTVG